MIRKVVLASLLAPLCWTSACTDPRPCGPGSQLFQKTKSPRHHVGGGRMMHGTRLGARALIGSRAKDAASEPQVDPTPPAAVSDLQVVEAHTTSVTVGWTATGDDGFEGVAAFYELRFSSQPITPENFLLATPVYTPVPAAAGTPESVTLYVPPASTIYLALMVMDEEFNESELSNVAKVTTNSGTVVYSEGAEDGLTGWTMDGLWHVTERSAAQGEHAVWYGQEDTGDYDTGSPNSGELTSPVISLAGMQNPVLLFSERIELEEWFDTADVLVSLADDPATFVRLTNLTGDTYGAFQPRFLPISGFTGADIRITFRFDADESINDLEGWYVDDIRIIDAGGAPPYIHDLCETGEPLDPITDSCVGAVCAGKSHCCEMEWDDLCVSDAQDLCGFICDAGGDDLTCPGCDGCVSPF